MIKSPLRYPGGKSRAVKFLFNFIPPYSEFREPFFGGGSVTFYLQQLNPAKTYKAADINFDLYCFWKELKFNTNKLIERVKSVYDNFNDGRILYKTILERRNDSLTDFQRAVDFFILNRITFSGVVDSGGYSEQAYYKRFTLSSIDRLKSASKIIQHVEFYNSDYSELLKYCLDDTFIFFDPPYFSATKSKLYGKNGDLHLNFDHEQFEKNLQSCNCKWLITYDDSPYIKELFKDYFILEWQLQYGMNNYKKNYSAKGKELLIANYDLEKIRNTSTHQHEFFIESE